LIPYANLTSTMVEKQEMVLKTSTLNLTLVAIFGL